MGKFKYDGDEPRTYPDLGLEVEPGDVVELDEPPGDGRWKPVAAKTKTTEDKE